MSKYNVEVSWQRLDAPFVDNKYSRAHEWTFDGGIVIRASSSPSVVPLPMSDAAAVDPEEAFVASISSCHMLWFLSIAAGQRFIVDAYRDTAAGTLARNDEGRLAMTTVTLKPKIDFIGERLPTADELHHLHHLAHHECFIANSVRTQIRIEPVLT